VLIGLEAKQPSGKVQFHTRLSGSESFTGRHLYRSLGSVLF
jgi:hypothetical protein